MALKVRSHLIFAKRLNMTCLSSFHVDTKKTCAFLKQQTNYEVKVEPHFKSLCLCRCVAVCGCLRNV